MDKRIHHGFDDRAVRHSVASGGDVMARPGTVSRTHDLTYYSISIHLVKTPGITHLWKVQESYKGRDLFHWYEDQEETRYRVCDNSCGHYGKKAETKLKWVCDSCLELKRKEESAKQEKQN